jgi:large-conductance mechanosensitive channel
MNQDEMMRRGAAEANAANDRLRATKQQDEQTALLREIRDLLKIIADNTPSILGTDE